MKLGQEKELLNEKIRKFIIENNSEDRLTKYKCKVCNGSGLKAHKLNEGGFSWQGEYCDFCDGVGYLNPKKIINLEYDLLGPIIRNEDNLF